MMLIQPYQAGWAADFSQINNELVQTLDGIDCVVEHVGSTSVPGLAAKPIIDIDIALSEGVGLEQVVGRLASRGYTHVGDQGIPQREVFKRRNPVILHPVLDQIDHHLYVCAFGSTELQRHLAFRDYLRAHPVARDAYAALKLEIALAARQDRKAYAVLKEERARDFVEGILALAGREDYQARSQVQGRV